MDPDPDSDPVPDAYPDPSIDLQDANKKLIYKKSFFCRLLFEVTYIIFQRRKVKKKSQNSRNQGFSY
jgi:hypothetical protein